MGWLKTHVLAIISGLLLLITCLGAALIIRPALAISSYDKSAVPVLVAAITLTAGITTAAVALVGHLLRQSIDLRTTRLAEEANKRAIVDQERLQMQTAMETVRLLATSDGNPAPPVQVSAALIVLSKLGETALALDLAAEMLPKKQLTASSAVAICDTAILSGDAELQRAAAFLLFNNWEELSPEKSDQAQWPSSLKETWPSHLDAEAQKIITKALTEWVAKTPGEGFRQRLIQASEARGLKVAAEL